MATPSSHSDTTQISKSLELGRGIVQFGAGLWWIQCQGVLTSTSQEPPRLKHLGVLWFYVAGTCHSLQTDLEGTRFSLNWRWGQNFTLQWARWTRPASWIPTLSSTKPLAQARKIHQGPWGDVLTAPRPLSCWQHWNWRPHNHWSWGAVSKGLASWTWGCGKWTNARAKHDSFRRAFRCVRYIKLGQPLRKHDNIDKNFLTWSVSNKSHCNLRRM